MENTDVTKNEERYISVREAAELMGYSRIHVVRLINAGQIKAKKVGRSFIVDKTTLPGVYKEITSKEKSEVDKAIKKVLTEYGDVIRKLGKE